MSVKLLTIDHHFPKVRQYKLNIFNLSFSELWLYGTPTAYRTLDYMSISGKKRDIRYESDGFFLNPGALEEFEHGGISLVRNTRAIELDPATKEITLDSGRKVKFDKCLIATGGKPTIPYPFYTPHLRNKVTTYSTVSFIPRHFIYGNFFPDLGLPEVVLHCS